MTTVSVESRWATMIGQLTGAAQKTAKSLPLSSVISEQEVQKLTKNMDKKFGCEDVPLLTTTYLFSPTMYRIEVGQLKSFWSGFTKG